MRADTPQSFYVYEHWRPDTGLPFYVGKGSANRANRKERNQWHRRIVCKLRNLGLDYEIRKVFVGLDEEMAFTLEKSQISYWRGRSIQLTNLTPGGEGSAGYKWTEEQRARGREKRSHPDVRARVSAAAKEAMARPEVKAKLSVALKSAFSKPEAKQRLREEQARRREIQRVSPKVRPKMSEKEKAEWSIECKRRMAQPDVMAKHSAKLKEAWARNREARLAILSKPEVRAKLSASVKASWNTRREKNNVIS